MSRLEEPEENKEVVYAGLIFTGGSALYTILVPPYSIGSAGSYLRQADSLSADGNLQIRSAGSNLKQSCALQYVGIATSMAGSVLTVWGAIDDDDSKVTTGSVLTIAGAGFNLLTSILLDRAGTKLEQTASMMER